VKKYSIKAFSLLYTGFRNKVERIPVGASILPLKSVTLPGIVTVEIQDNVECFENPTLTFI